MIMKTSGIDEVDQAIAALYQVISELASLEIIPGQWQDWKDAAAPSTTPPSATFPFLLVERNLGIPEKTVYQLLPRCTDFKRATEPEEILQKTTVVMIANPANQTALHARKRLVTLQQHDPEHDTRLTGHLVRTIKPCAKESVIWAHRRWCFNRLFDAVRTAKNSRRSAELESGQHGPSSRRIPPTVARDEFDTIRAACTLYPRNYHAWSHWHYLFAHCLSSLQCDPLHADLRSLVINEYQALEKWVRCNVSDYSAMHHFLLASELLQEFVTDDPESIRQWIQPKTVSDLVKDCWSSLSSFPSYETPFLVLRCLLPRLPESERQSYLDQLPQVDFPPARRDALMKGTNTYQCIST